MATVLIVEDEDQLRRSLKIYLECRGFMVAEEDKVETAIEALEACLTTFDVILLDINLPDGTGWDVLRYLRDRADVLAAAPLTRQLPHVIVMSAARPTQCRLDEFQPAEVLLKPFPMDVLVRLLDHVLAERLDAGTVDRSESARLRAARTGVAEIQNQLIYADDAPRDDVDLDVEDAFGNHDIEYWVRHGNKLVPATEDEVAQIQEWERESSALVRLTDWKQQEHRQANVGSGFARLLRGVEWARERVRRSHRLLESGDERTQRRQRSSVKPTNAHEHDQHATENLT
jgi:CheY-like chemotaxis protein